MPLSKSLPRLTAVPAARSRAAVLQLRVAVVLGLLLACAVIGVASGVAWMLNKPVPPVLTGVVSQGRGVAELVARAWLSGTEIPVPAVPGLDLPSERDTPMAFNAFAWEGFTTSTLPNGVPYEMHRFLFTTPYKTDEGTATRTLRITVPVALASTGTMLAALPLIEQPALFASGRKFDYSDLPGFPVQGLSQVARDQLDKWVKAWASDNREQLKQLSGDRTPGVQYQGLGQFKVDRFDVVNAIVIRPDVDLWLVRTRAKLVGPNGFATSMDMDVTVSGGSSGLPAIVGWGPAGSGALNPDQVRIPEN